MVAGCCWLAKPPHEPRSRHQHCSSPRRCKARATKAEQHLHQQPNRPRWPNPKQDISITVSEILPKRLAHIICNENNVNGNICELSNKILTSLSNSINAWAINPTGTEGYRTAEVTLGGIDTEEISSKTMMSNKHPGLFFIGEVVDVTGHLGGYNFQWAWSSGYVAGQYA